MSTEKEMSTKYDPTAVEAGRYQWWIDQGLFKPSGDKKAHPYSIVIPPPNVTGKLHLGHAWDTTLQDMIIRQKRMQGYDVLWLPGMDHAGIATQAKVEARLRKQGISRYDLFNKFGTGKMNMLTLFISNGPKWGFPLIMIGNDSPLIRD